jgi:hypothetical protein
MKSENGALSRVGRVGMAWCEWASVGPAYQRDLLTALIMGFTAGYTTGNTKVRTGIAYCVKTPPRQSNAAADHPLHVCAQVRFNTFGGMMTGNTVKLGITMQQGQWAWTGIYFACIINFALGTIFALFMLQKAGSTRGQNALLLVLCGCFLAVDGLALAVDRDGDGEYNLFASLTSSLAAFALGAQNLASQSEYQC